MRRAALAVSAILLAAPAQAHCFSRWFYPWKQNCRATALAPLSLRSRARIDVVLPVPRPIDIPLPSLTDIDWGAVPDDELRGRLLLRATLRGDNE